jgi:hypothetical protein
MVAPVQVPGMEATVALVASGATVLMVLMVLLEPMLLKFLLRVRAVRGKPVAMAVKVALAARQVRVVLTALPVSMA